MECVDKGEFWVVLPSGRCLNVWDCGWCHVHVYFLEDVFDGFRVFGGCKDDVFKDVLVYLCGWECDGEECARAWADS